MPKNISFNNTGLYENVEITGTAKFFAVKYPVQQQRWLSQTSSWFMGSKGRSVSATVLHYGRVDKFVCIIEFQEEAFRCFNSVLVES